MTIDNILEILENSADENERYMAYLRGINGFPSLSEIIKEEYNNTPEFNKTEAVDCILTCIGYFLDDCSGFTMGQKNKISKDLQRWLDNVTYDLGLPNINIHDTDSNHVIDDPEIEIIKALHVYKNSPIKGITKKELADNLEISEKTVKDIINKLDNKQRSSSLRIAGQKVTLKLKESYTTATSNGNRFKVFSSESTVNPIFLQFNISQVFSLLNGCKLSYVGEGRNMALYTAMEIWDQLSPYTKGKIKSFYCNRYPDFAEFISDVEAEIASSDLHAYVSEREQMEDMDLKNDEINETYDKLNSNPTFS